VTQRKSNVNGFASLDTLAHQRAMDGVLHYIAVRTLRDGVDIRQMPDSRRGSVEIPAFLDLRTDIRRCGDVAVNNSARHFQAGERRTGSS